jgi:hypothetical protein
MLENIGIKEVNELDINLRNNGTGTCQHGSYVDRSHKIFYKITVENKELFLLFFKEIWNNKKPKLNYSGTNNDELIISKEEFDKLLMISKRNNKPNLINKEKYKPTPEDKFPKIHFSKENIDFGDVVVLSGKSENITITNTGTSDLDLVNFISFNEVFTFDKLNINILKPNETVNFKIYFKPNDYETFNGYILIKTNIGYKNINLTGRGIKI